MLKDQIGGYRPKDHHRQGLVAPCKIAPDNREIDWGKEGGNYEHGKAYI